MNKNEKVYLGISVLMALATFSLFLPEPYIFLIWDSRGHYPSLPGVIFSGMSPILAIYGLFLIGKAMERKKDTLWLTIATILIINFFIVAAFLRLNPFLILRF